MASFAEEGSPFNKVAGLGFGGVPSAAALNEIEQAFTAYGAPVQIELAHLVDPAIAALLTERGYRLESFENVLGRSLTDQPERITPPGIEVRLSGDDEFDSWLEVVADGVAHPDTPKECPGTKNSPARSTCEPSVISRRPASCATPRSATASSSQQNAQRQGFDLLYTRAILVKQP